MIEEFLLNAEKFAYLIMFLKNSFFDDYLFFSYTFNGFSSILSISFLFTGKKQLLLTVIKILHTHA